MTYRLHTLSILTLGLLLAACSSKQREAFENANDLKPEAKGDNYEILVVMDKAKAEGPVGEAIREAFGKPLDGMFRPEPEFVVKFVSIIQFNSLLEEHRNLMFVTTLDNKSQSGQRMLGYFNESSRQEIARGERSMLKLRDKYAKGQQVVHIFAKDDRTLIANLQKDLPEILQTYRNYSLERLSEELYARGEQTDLERELLDAHGFMLRVPSDYLKVLNEERFFWMRFPGSLTDKNVFASYRPYESEAQFEKENILAWRQQICKQYLYSDREKYPESWLTLQDFPVSAKQVKFNGRFGVQLRGLWRANGRMTGGPFVAYAFYDEASGRQYYLEGFVHAPGERKRPALSELEAVIGSFQTQTPDAQPER